MMYVCVCVCIYIYVCLFVVVCGWSCTFYDGIPWLGEQPSRDHGCS